MLLRPAIDRSTARL